MQHIWFSVTLQKYYNYITFMLFFKILLSKVEKYRKIVYNREWGTRKMWENEKNIIYNINQFIINI